MICSNCGKNLKKIKQAQDEYVCLNCGNKCVIVDKPLKSIDTKLNLVIICSILSNLIGLGLIILFIGLGFSAYYQTLLFLIPLQFFNLSTCSFMYTTTKIEKALINFIETKDEITYKECYDFWVKFFTSKVKNFKNDKLPVFDDKAVFNFKIELQKRIDKGYLSQYVLKENCIIRKSKLNSETKEH